ERNENIEEFESSMSTEPVDITVKPIPVKTKPTSFDGAVGLFTIAAKAVKNKLSKNEGDVLEVTISGKGNFVQLNAPSIQWPAGIEGFEPSVKDSLNKMISPLTGSRTYRYAFTGAASGAYTIPSITFSFFNADSGNYKTFTTAAVKINIENKNTISTESIRIEEHRNTGKPKYWLTIALLLVGVGIWSLFFNNKKRKALQIDKLWEAKEVAVMSIEEMLIPAALLAHGDDKQFYILLRQSIWNFFDSHFNLSGSAKNKENIVAKMRERKLDSNVINELQTILQQCEAVEFTNAKLVNDKVILLNQAKELFKKIESGLTK
ncbi:MAG: BatD family protein, partial [Chitinophagaceae bacterium]